jgi:hypothetical protein
MNPLESRKQLLIAESELNRAQLAQVWQTMAGQAHALAEQARTIRSLASATAVLVTGLAALRLKKATPADTKLSRFQNLLKGAGLISNLWQMFRPAPRAQRENI